MCFAAVTACAGKKHATWAYTPPAQVSVVPTSVPVGRYGIGCRTVNAPNEVGPPSYSVKDTGKPGVPALTKKEAHDIRVIERYVHSPTLRFARIFPRFIVFDANQGPCFEGAAGYWIMNDPVNDNLYYQPGEAPGDIHAVPGDGSMPHPWLKDL
jgi:hypothetical protein